MKKLLFLSFTIAFFVSCKKNKDETCTLSVSALSGNHKITAVRYKATPAAAEVDYYATFFPDACDRDDIITLNSNGTYAVTDAGVVCVPSNSDSGVWSLSGNTVTIDGDAANVDAFTCTTITLGQSGVFVVDDKLILVLTRQ